MGPQDSGARERFGAGGGEPGHEFDVKEFL